MGYRVDYQPIKKVRGAEKQKTRVPALTAACLLLFLFLANSLWPRGGEVLRCVLFSGDAAVTVSALEDLAMQLKAGEELPSAFETFCRTVIRGADVAVG